jgi:hypothetical protein
MPTPPLRQRGMRCSSSGGSLAGNRASRAGRRPEVRRLKAATVEGGFVKCLCHRAQGLSGVQSLVLARVLCHRVRASSLQMQDAWGVAQGRNAPLSSAVQGLVSGFPRLGGGPRPMQGCSPRGHALRYLCNTVFQARPGLCFWRVPRSRRSRQSSHLGRFKCIRFHNLGARVGLTIGQPDPLRQAS